MPEVSVIVPAYNVEMYIQQCIESIIHQTLKNIEIIIVNDGSSDKTGEICEKYAMMDARIFYIETENKGVAWARNTGIEKAAAKWLCFIDGDDYLPEGALETLYSNIGETDIIIGNYNTDKAGNIRQEKFFLEKVSVQDKSSTRFLVGNALGCSFYGVGYTANVGVPWARLYRKDFLAGVLFPALKRMQDTVFNITLFLQKPQITYINRNVYNYRIRGNSAVHGYRPDFDTIANLILECLRPLVKENVDSKIAELYHFKKLMLLLENIKLTYAHPQCRLSLKEKVEGIKILCNNTSFKDVFKVCNKELFSTKQYLLLLLLFHKHYRIVYFIYRCKMKWRL